MSDTITLARYLFERLHQEPIGLQSIFGVPGDFNLTLLDKVSEVEGLKWRGCSNELNAAYATDGYSRVRGNASTNGLGFGALVTTYGVGELSAINGVAGSYAEHVGLLHIVGYPSLVAQKKQLLLHHTLGEGNYDTFNKMADNISQADGILDHPVLAPDVIDRVIREAYIHQRPGYLGFPSDMVNVQVPKLRLDKPLDLSPLKNDPKVQAKVLEKILGMIKNSQNPVIIVDVCCGRYNVTKEAAALIEATQFKYATAPMAKGTRNIDENGKRFTGIYVGSLSYEDTKKSVEESDLVISLGFLPSDFNTGAFSYCLSENFIELHSDHTIIGDSFYNHLAMKELLTALVQLPELKDALAHHDTNDHFKNEYSIEPMEKSGKITQKWLWNRLSVFLKPEDIVITESGTASFGIISTRFPKDVFGISQILWGSIGYSVGATLGAAAAAKETNPDRRVILFVGDGSLQMSVQEISTMVRNDLHPYLFILNNEGYTVEKLIHGPEEDYNQIQLWDHQLLLPAFGAKHYESLKVGEAAELKNLFNDDKFNKNDRIRLIELLLDSKDAPQNLVEQAKLASKVNSN